MQQTQQLYINNQLVDMLPDAPLQYTLQTNDLGQLDSQQANFSKIFKLPLTQRNRQILGYPDDVTITTEAPYRQLPAQYIVDGIQIIRNGILEIQNTQNDIANVMLLTGNAGLMELLAYQVYDMGDSLSPASKYGQNKVWDAYNDCVWNVANAALSQQKTDGWLFPVIDYGQIPRLDADWKTTPLNVLGMRPAFFLHTAIELLIKSTGYRIDDLHRLSSYPFYPAALGELELRRGNYPVAKSHFSTALSLARNPTERNFFQRRMDKCKSL